MMAGDESAVDSRNGDRQLHGGAHDGLHMNIAAMLESMLGGALRSLKRIWE